MKKSPAEVFFTARHETYFFITIENILCSDPSHMFSIIYECKLSRMLNYLFCATNSLPLIPSIYIESFIGDTKRFAEKSFLFWFLGILFTLVLNFHLLRNVAIRECFLKSQEMNYKIAEELERLRVQRKTYYLNIVKDCGKFINSLQRHGHLNYEMRLRKVSHDLFSNQQVFIDFFLLQNLLQAI